MDFLQEYERTEIIHGIEYAMSPPTLEHQTVQDNLSHILKGYLDGKRCQVFTGAGVKFEKNENYIPDLVVVCDPKKLSSRGINGAPDFIAEILSLSTKKRDLTTKKKAYEKYGVKEYWVIDPKAESIEVYLPNHTSGHYELDNVYQNATEADMEGLTEAEKADIHISLKLSLYDDLVIQVKDIFKGLELLKK